MVTHHKDDMTFHRLDYHAEGFEDCKSSLSHNVQAEWKRLSFEVQCPENQDGSGSPVSPCASFLSQTAITANPLISSSAFCSTSFNFLSALLAAVREVVL